jgi:hypothetical protein
MYGNTKKSQAAALRSAERKKREGEAPRLAVEVPALTSLRIEVTEHVPNGTSKHVKLVVIAHAPALFIITCGETACQDGGHDITREVMWALRSRQAEATGSGSCDGTIGNGHCTRRITYRMLAEYARDRRPSTPPDARLR